MMDHQPGEIDHQTIGPSRLSVGYYLTTISTDEHQRLVLYLRNIGDLIDDHEHNLINFLLKS